MLVYIFLTTSFPVALNWQASDMIGPNASSELLRNETMIQEHEPRASCVSDHISDVKKGTLNIFLSSNTVDLALTDRQLGHLATTVLYLAENIILEKKTYKD